MGGLCPGRHHSGPIAVEGVQKIKGGRNEVGRDLAMSEQVHDREKKEGLVRGASIQSNPLRTAHRRFSANITEGVFTQMQGSKAGAKGPRHITVQLSYLMTVFE
jgi:hypothetical protein